VLHELNIPRNDDVIVGTETNDDAGVYRLSEELALVQTADYITPVVDDPFLFGQVAAANSLSDVYAMGGRPLTVLNLCNFPPQGIENKHLLEILRGGLSKTLEAGAMLVVGNNPHRVQGMETFPNGAVVAYALGNFVFDQEWSDGTQYTLQGVMLRATFRGAQLQGIELIPIHIYDNFQPRLAPPEEAVEILRQVAESAAKMPGR